MDTKKLTLSAMLISIGVILGNIIYIPIGVSKCFPIQHAINLISAVLMGPFFSTGIAFVISLLRNILGTGSLLAFPGSMVGAFLAGVIYYRTKNKYITAMGEIVGTGIIGGLIAVPIAKHIMGKEIGALFFVYPFLLSTVTGTIIGLVALKAMSSIKNTKIKESL